MRVEHSKILDVRSPAATHMVSPPLAVNSSAGSALVVQGTGWNVPRRGGGVGYLKMMYWYTSAEGKICCPSFLRPSVPNERTATHRRF